MVGAIVLCFGALKAQPSLGLSNANGMPSVISQGGFYSLSGWIVNRGNQAFSGTVDMRININGSYNGLLTNNFPIPSLPAGDSIFWQEPSYNFPPGQLRLGNNDILVWPTAPSGGPINEDTLAVTMYNSDGQAAFRLSDEGVEDMLPGIQVDQYYTFEIGAVNIGLAPSTDVVKLIAELPGSDRRSLDACISPVAIGSTAKFNVEAFKVSELFDLTGMVGSENLPALQFFVEMEQLAIDPVNRIEFPLVRPTAVSNGVEGPAVSLYPNPSNGSFLQVRITNGSQLQSVSIFDAAMREVLTSNLSKVDVSDLAAGVYAVKVTTDQGIATRQFVRQ